LKAARTQPTTQLKLHSRKRHQWKGNNSLWKMLSTTREGVQ
jgi:hypothetical protein